MYLKMELKGWSLMWERQKSEVLVAVGRCWSCELLFFGFWWRRIATGLSEELLQVTPGGSTTFAALWDWKTALDTADVNGLAMLGPTSVAKCHQPRHSKWWHWNRAVRHPSRQGRICAMFQTLVCPSGWHLVDQLRSMMGDEIPGFLKGPRSMALLQRHCAILFWYWQCFCWDRLFAWSWPHIFQMINARDFGCLWYQMRRMIFLRLTCGVQVLDPARCPGL